MKKSLLSLSLIALSTVPTTAHRSWILPAMTVYAEEGAWATFDAAVSNDLFAANHHGMSLETVKAIAPDGTPLALVNMAEGEIRSTFDLQLNKKGTYKVVNSRASLRASWEEGGERKRWRGTPEEFDQAKLAEKDGIVLKESVRTNVTYLTNG